MAIERVRAYSTSMTEREARAAVAALRKVSGEPGVSVVLDRLEWLAGGIESGDRDMAALAEFRDESPSDYGEDERDPVIRLALADIAGGENYVHDRHGDHEANTVEEWAELVCQHLGIEGDVELAELHDDTDAQGCAEWASSLIEKANEEAGPHSLAGPDRIAGFVADALLLAHWRGAALAALAAAYVMRDGPDVAVHNATTKREQM